MEFKKRDHLVIVDNLGYRNGHARNYYFHSGTLQEVPLGSMGFAKQIGRDWISLKLDNLEWLVHPLEVDFVDLWKRTQRYLPEIHKLPLHPVFELANNNPIFFVDGCVYTICDSIESNDYYEKHSFFGLRKERKPLIKVADIACLDELALCRANAKMKEQALAYIPHVRERLDLYRTLEGEVTLQQLIYLRVFPYLRDEKYADVIAELMGLEKDEKSRNKSNRETLKKAFQNIVSQVQSLREYVDEEGDVKGVRTPIEKRLDTLFGYEKKGGADLLLRDVISGRNLAIKRGKVYSLVYGEGRDGEHLSLAQKKFFLEKNSVPSRLEQEVLVKLGKQIRLHALDEHFSEEKIKALVEGVDASFLEVIDQNEYHGNGFGFMSSGRTMYVYLEVPSFILQSQFDNEFYFFKKTRIGVAVSKNGDGSLTCGSGFWMIDNNNHPFLHNEGGMFARICVGGQNFPTEGKSAGDVIAKRLRRCREVLLYGYTREDYGYCYRLEKWCRNGGEHFNKNLVLREWAEKSGHAVIQGGKRK